MFADELVLKIVESEWTVRDQVTKQVALGARNEWTAGTFFRLLLKSTIQISRKDTIAAVPTSSRSIYLMHIY